MSGPLILGDRHEAGELWTPPKSIVREHFSDGALVEIMRGHKAKQRLEKVGKTIRLGPNEVHAYITHKDGTVTDLGISKNLLTNIGRDWWSDSFGASPSVGGQGSPATASSATSLTGTGSVWTASNLATPQLGQAGKVVIVPITNLTTTPVMGLIVSNTTNVLTVDKWWTPDLAGTGTTPASTSAFQILPGRGPGAIFMALTTNASAASAASTALTGEITNNGGARTKATYAHTYGAATATHVVVFSITGTLTAVHRMGLFPTSGAADASPLIFEAVLNQDATLGNGDTLTVTDTITYSG